MFDAALTLGVLELIRKKRVVLSNVRPTPLEARAEEKPTSVDSDGRSSDQLVSR
jgi:hypothetical protein